MGRSMADGMALPLVITNEFFSCINALQAYEGKSSDLIPPGPRSRVGTRVTGAYPVTTQT